MAKDKELREKFSKLVNETLPSRSDYFINYVKDYFKNLVECETCGCLLKKETAIRGKSEVREKNFKTAFAAFYNMSDYKEEYIHENWYCKIHQPKKK
jgi:hypothetical protein